MRYQLSLLFTLFLAGYAMAQNTPYKYQSPLDSLLAAQKVGPQEPGFAVCILAHDQIVYEYQAGLSNLATQKAIGAETIFNIGSVSKQFTATCILLLEEAGKLSRTDPIQKYVPELPDFGQPITLDHLIGHTSGLYPHIDVLNLRKKFKNRFLEPAFVFSFYQKSPEFSFQPGSDFAYNNTAYLLLSIVIERVSGMSSGQYMDKNIFQPLGMRHARFCLEETEGLTDGTTSYEYKTAKKRYKKSKAIHNMLGATGVHCSLRDLALWQQNFDHNRLGKGNPELIRQMETSYVLADGSSTHYGAGLVTKNYRGLPTIEHGGGWNSFLVQCRRFPEQGISVLVASNNDRYVPFPIADAICDKLFDFKPLPPKSDSNLGLLNVHRQQLEGSYLSFNNRLRYVRCDADTLKIRLDESSSKRELSLRFEPDLSTDTLLTFLDPSQQYPLQFVLRANGQIPGFYWDGGDYFQCRRYFEKLDTTSILAAQWTGKYKGAEFDQKLRIRAKGNSGALKLKPVVFLGYTLDPITPSVYKMRGERIIVRFSEKGFVLGHDWVSNLNFSKIR